MAGDAYTKFYIHDYEFRKSVNANKDEVYGWVSVNHRLIMDDINLLGLFRDNHDVATVRISRKFNINLKFSRDCIKIFNRYSNTNYSNIKDALGAVIDQLEDDMNYLKRKGKLPRSLRHRAPEPPADPEPQSTNPPVAYMPSTFPGIQQNYTGALMPLPEHPDSQQQQQQAAYPYVYHGFVAAIQNPTSDTLVKLFMNNIPYVLVPEYAFNA
jgi:hypothetical protein